MSENSTLGRNHLATYLRNICTTTGTTQVDWIRTTIATKTQFSGFQLFREREKEKQIQFFCNFETILRKFLWVLFCEQLIRNWPVLFTFGNKEKINFGVSQFPKSNFHGSINGGSGRGGRESPVRSFNSCSNFRLDFGVIIIQFYDNLFDDNPKTIYNFLFVLFFFFRNRDSKRNFYDFHRSQERRFWNLKKKNNNENPTRPDLRLLHNFNGVQRTRFDSFSWCEEMGLMDSLWISFQLGWTTYTRITRRGRAIRSWRDGSIRIGSPASQNRKFFPGRELRVWLEDDAAHWNKMEPLRTASNRFDCRNAPPPLR